MLVETNGSFIDMSSARASTSRLSVEEWDSLSPLSSLANQSIHQLDDKLKLKALPPHLLPGQPTHPSRPDTPNSSSGPRKGSRLDLHALLNSPSSSPRPASRATHAHLSASECEVAELSEPIATSQQFHDWFARVEHSMERDQEDVYRAHLAELEGHIGSCDVVLEQLDDARGLLSEMEANYRFVEENSRALQLACETMLDEQVRHTPTPPPTRLEQLERVLTHHAA